MVLNIDKFFKNHSILEWEAKYKAKEEERKKRAEAKVGSK